MSIKRCFRKFMEKESWKRNFMSGQAYYKFEGIYLSF